MKRFGLVPHNSTIFWENIRYVRYIGFYSGWDVGVTVELWRITWFDIKFVKSLSRCYYEQIKWTRASAVN